MTIDLCTTTDQALPTKMLRRAARLLLSRNSLNRAEVSIVLTSDVEMRELNRLHRGKDQPTDVLSFAQRDSVNGAPTPPAGPGAPLVLGDVVISADTAYAQAQQQGVSIEREIAHLTVHGILHLLGYEDETEKGAEAMRVAEAEIMAEVVGGAQRTAA